MNRGIISAIFAYIIWGFFPIYFKMLSGIPAIQVTAHRIAWSFVLLMLVTAIRGELASLKKAATRRNLLIYLGAGILLAANWGLYVWGVIAGYVVEASLGYFINPLVSVLLGVIFLKERLRPLQWVPVGLAAAGVLYLTLEYGRLPWLALALAFTFGFYGLIKKTAPLGSMQGLTLETGAIWLPAVIFLVGVEIAGQGSFIHAGFQPSLLMILSGVMTTVPLLLFSTGARSVPLSTVGILQFIAPTLQLLSGVFIFHEAFDQSRLIGFSAIWLALIIFTVEGFLARPKKLAAEPA